MWGLKIPLSIEHILRLFNAFCDAFSFKIIALKYGLTDSELRDLYFIFDCDLNNLELDLIDKYESKENP